MSFDVDFVNIGLDFLLAVRWDAVEADLSLLLASSQLWSIPNSWMTSTDSLSRYIIVFNFFLHVQLFYFIVQLSLDMESCFFFFWPTAFHFFGKNMSDAEVNICLFLWQPSVSFYSSWQEIHPGEKSDELARWVFRVPLLAGGGYISLYLLWRASPAGGGHISLPLSTSLGWWWT